jgi:uncharacterized membrane protein YtjA (UPF0391 family)
MPIVRIMGHGLTNLIIRLGKVGSMLYYSLVFFVIALIAAFFGFSGIAAGAAEIAKILFFVFLIITIISILVGVFYAK